ncbi:MAG: DUF389 domain-containing protein [Bacteroidaceae bacterium]|nr:DUF389 domain-containing protein [Bacteroidaceae bacterium]
MDINKITEKVKYYFNLMPDKDDEQVIIEQINSGVSFRGATLWVLIFAIFMASLGLNVNSTAVIIGAMLISPLMGPIIGMGLAVGINDLDLLKRAAKSFGVATLISVLTAMVYFFLSPLGEARSELLARTSPTLYDVFIAFCGGAAGIIALCTRGKGNVIPGVAIATALMPPLCTAGYGLATGHFLYFLGAFYLFFINSVFIALATYCGVRLMHFRQREFRSSEMGVKASRIVMAIVVLTMLPAVVMTVSIVRQSIFDNNVLKFIKAELTQRGTQVISSDVEKDSLRLRVVAVGREITESTRLAAERRMEQYGMEGYSLRIIQGVQTDSILALNNQLSQISTTREADHRKLLELSAQATRLTRLTTQLNSYTRLDNLSAEIRPEMSTLFPQVNTLALARAAEAVGDTVNQHHYVIALVGVAANKSLTPMDRLKLQQWLQIRIDEDSLVVIEK